MAQTQNWTNLASIPSVGEELAMLVPPSIEFNQWPRLVYIASSNLYQTFLWTHVKEKGRNSLIWYDGHLDECWQIMYANLFETLKYFNCLKYQGSCGQLVRRLRLNWTSPGSSLGFNLNNFLDQQFAIQDFIFLIAWNLTNLLFLFKQLDAPVPNYLLS
jgi:hypothetical protein